MRRWLLCCYASLLALCGTLSAGAQHTLTLDEFFRLEDIHAVSIASGGRDLAIVRSRARSKGERYFGGRLLPHQREDIWLAKSGKPAPLRQLTFGSLDGSSFWQPVWSPDSRHILILSNRGFDNVHLELLDVHSGRIKRLSKRGVDLEARVITSQPGVGFGSERESVQRSPMAWLDNRRVLFVELADGEVSTAMSEGTKQIGTIQRNWNKTEAGNEPSFSRLDSIKAESSRPTGRLVVADVETGRLTQLSEGVLRIVTVSPDNRFASIIAEGRSEEIDKSALMHFTHVWHIFPSTWRFHTRFEVVRLDGKAETTQYPEVVDPGFDFVPHGPNGEPNPGIGVETYSGPMWLAHDGRVAVLAKGVDSEENSDVLYIVDVDRKTSHKVEHPKLAVFGMAVLGNEVLLRGTQDLKSLYDPAHTYAWYSLLSDVPKEIAHTSSPGLGQFVPITDKLAITLDTQSGRLCVIRMSQCEEYAGSEDLRGASLLWPDFQAWSPLGNGGALLKTQSGALKTIRPFKENIAVEPFHDRLPGKVVSFEPQSRTLVTVDRSGTGTDLYLKSPDSSWEQLLRLNSFLKDVGTSTFLDLHFKAGDGRDSTARLYLPPDYHGGVRLPVITSVYISQRYDLNVSNNNATFDNLALAFQYGFAVLVPTINPPEYSFKFAPYQSLPRDVIPAVSAAVASGIADHNRIYLLGHSYGAYSTYSLVEQTNVFAAAAAINGPSDLLSEYLDLDPNGRREGWAFDHSGTQAELETEHAFMALGTAPWNAFDRYMENSPVRHIDRVETPLLIFHSDTDVFDMHQADNMFAGMVRLHKEARYIRFWGEPHSFDSPANIRQFWTELVEWFSGHRKPTSGE